MFLFLPLNLFTSISKIDINDQPMHPQLSGWHYNIEFDVRCRIGSGPCRLPASVVIYSRGHIVGFVLAMRSNGVLFTCWMRLVAIWGNTSSISPLCFHEWYVRCNYTSNSPQESVLLQGQQKNLAAWQWTNWPTDQPAVRQCRSGPPLMLLGLWLCRLWQISQGVTTCIYPPFMFSMFT